MTFEEAIEKKKEVGDKLYMEEIGLTGDVRVVPSKLKNFSLYIENYRINKMRRLTDETSKLFCSDNKYQLCSIKVEDGVTNYKMI